MRGLWELVSARGSRKVGFSEYVQLNMRLYKVLVGGVVNGAELRETAIEDWHACTRPLKCVALRQWNPPNHKRDFVQKRDAREQRTNVES